MATSSTTSKVGSDTPRKVEADAAIRKKRKAETRGDATSKSQAADGSKKTKKASAAAAHGGKCQRGRSKGAGAKKSIKRVREERRLQHAADARRAAQEAARRSDLALDDREGSVVAAPVLPGASAAAPENFFWEVEAVIGRRLRRGRVEYLIRWKGCGEDGNTWEPPANLCDTAMEEATKYHKALKLKETQRAEDEKKLFGVSEDAGDGNDEGRNTKDATEDVESKGGNGEDAVIEDAGNEVVMDEPVNEVAIDGPVVVIDAPKANTTANSIDDKKANTTADSIDDKMAVESETSVVDDHRWKWGDADQVVFRDVQRINVHDPHAANTVKDARINGTPVVLVGHVGWANFTKRWLTDKTAAKGKSHKKAANGDGAGENEGGAAVPLSADTAAAIDKASATEPTAGEGERVGGKTTVGQLTRGEDKKADPVAPSDNDFASEDLLDLSQQNYELDVAKMIEDIGEEDVPVIKRHYNEVKPIHGKIAAEKFLTSCWPAAEPDAAAEERDKTAKCPRNSNLYLHQWQFPLSDTAGRKLCHQNKALPHGIMGEDLLKYWLDLPQCKLDSPLQYIFMGREDTLSKLHRDPGGLAISIAPIVGRKECVLVHRSDGSNCLYHLTASLNDIDLQRHPLLTQARTWRTIIQPGEILLMPYGTYHQCRNVTPCLSYSRFHLDTVNLLAFVQSLVNGDAPEIDHEEVLWNLTSELINRVDGVFDEVQLRVKAGSDEGDLITGDVVETVNTLRTLRHFAREVARREEIRQVVKGAAPEVLEHNFGMLVDDVDMCLHEFRYRRSVTIPPFKACRVKALKNTLSGGSRKGVIKRDMSKFGIGSKPVVAFNTSLENNYMSLVNADLDKHFPHAARDKAGESLIGELVAGDKISVKLEQKCVKAEVVEILQHMKSAYLSFEDYPSVYDEYQPYGLIRLPTGAEIPPEDVKPGLVVIDLSNSNEYRAKIQSTVDGPMVRVKLIVSQHEMIRLVSTSMILGRYVPPKRKHKQPTANIASDTAATQPKEKIPIERPREAGQIVKVGRRGAARVIKVHGEPPTYVDVRFILGTAHTENMVPIEMVELAPELDPALGRGRRQVSKKTAAPDPIEGKKNGSEASKMLAGGLVSPSNTDWSGD